MLQRPLRSATTTVLALACAIAVAGSLISGCVTVPAGPLQTLTEQGQPVVGAGGVPVAPGQPVDGTALVVNTSRQPVTLVSASVVPVPGYRAGLLVHLGVDASVDIVTPGINWPPGVPVTRFSGAKLPAGESRIIFGFTGNQAGRNYAAAGIRITYTYQGRDLTVTAWSGIMACVTRSHQQSHAARYCQALGGSFTTAVRKVAGLG